MKNKNTSVLVQGVDDAEFRQTEDTRGIRRSTSPINRPQDLSINDPTYLHRVGLYRSMTRHAANIRGAVLDYGCGKRPYQQLFVNYSSYVGADVAENPEADVFYQKGERVPLDDGSFDAVVSTEVLQSVRDPEHYLGECRRLLRPGGILLLSTHGFWCYLGDDRDWRRWTHRGLIYEIEKAGFRVVDLDAICIRRAFLCQFINIMIVSRLVQKRAIKPLGRGLAQIFNRIGNLYPAEILSCSAARQSHLAIVYLVVAVAN